MTSNLGLADTSGKKAELGNIVHKALELLARKKLALQKKESSFGDPEISIIFNTLEFNPEEAIATGWNHYTDPLKTIHSWEEGDRKKAKKWVWDVLLYNNGMFNPLNREIVMPEEYFDMEIPEEWARYEYTIPGEKGTFSGQLRIKGTMDLVTRVKKGLIEYVDWKGLTVDTPIPTEDGWSTMGELKVGDIVFDKDGNKTKVLAKSSKSYKPCYKIIFDDKSSVVCDNEHLWLLDNGDVKQVTDLKVKDCIPLAKPIGTENRPLPIDPYVFGLWLGDGRNRGGEITSADNFVFEEIVRRGYLVGNNIEKRDKKAQSRTIFGLTTDLRFLNVLRNKHIPMQYLRASHSQRVDLLRGLMDTDGNVNKKRKQCVFTSCNKILSDNVKELLLSLGQRVNQSSIVRDTIFKKNVSIFPLAFRPININPFLLPRKFNFVGVWGPGVSDKRRIVSIDLLDTQLETQCIMVDSPSNTYLCTKNMIPTHNTGLRKDWTTGKEKDYEGLRKDFQMRLYHYALCKLYPKDDILMTIFFVQAGGAFTLFLDRSHLGETESLIKTYFQAIQMDDFPRRVKDSDPGSWKCSRLCAFHKDEWADSGKSSCQFFREQILSIGLENVTAKYKISKSPWGSYGSGGGVTDRKEEK